MKLRGWTALLLAAAAIIFLFCGCDGAKAPADRYESTSDSYYADTDWFNEAEFVEAEAPAQMEEQGAGLAGETIGAAVVDSSRKLIYTADYTIETYKYEEDYSRILQSLAACGGFISSEVTWGVKPEAYGDAGRTTDFSLRIPIEQYKSFLDALAGVGEATHKTQTANDVTVSYYDNEARIELYEAHYDKLMEYLKNATEMADIIALESEMTDILYTLDALKGQQRYYDDQIAYTTVSIHLKEMVAPMEVVTSKESLGTRMSNAFMSVLKGLGVFFEGFLVVLVGALPILAILGILFCAIFFPVRAASRRKAKKRAEAAERMKPPSVP
ncbi:MAG: DUF4349 domain-containing protein [Christensenellales bacterium]|jgi:hypothetical protein